MERVSALIVNRINLNWNLSGHTKISDTAWTIVETSTRLRRTSAPAGNSAQGKGDWAKIS